jgi:hypothetical protein
LIADLVTPLVAVALPFAAVFNARRAILGQVLPGCSWPSSIPPRPAGDGARGSTADSSRRELRPSALQEIGRRAAPSCRASDARAAGRTRNIEEFINIAG